MSLSPGPIMEGVVTAFYFDRIGNLPSWSGPKNQCRVTSKQMVINSIHPPSLITKLVGFRTWNRGKSTLCPFLNYILANFVFILILQDYAVWHIYLLALPKNSIYSHKTLFSVRCGKGCCIGKTFGQISCARPSSANQHLRDFLFWELVLRCWSTPTSSKYLDGSKL